MTGLRRRSSATCVAGQATSSWRLTLPVRCSRRKHGQSAAPWLFTIAQNKLTDARRRGQVESRARRRLGLREAVAYDDETLDRIESTVSQTGWVTKLLERLPDDQREAVRARILDERPYGEIAGELQTSELVVRKRVSRGLAALRKSLEETR